MKNKTHVAAVAENRLSVEEQILKYSTLTEMERKARIYQMGLAFLRLQYPKCNPAFNGYIAQLERSPQYWKWFRQEWYQWEQDYTQFIIQHEPKIGREEYYQEMLPMLQDHRTLHSYSMFLKIFKDQI